MSEDGKVIYQNLQPDIFSLENVQSWTCPVLILKCMHEAIVLRPQVSPYDDPQTAHSSFEETKLLLESSSAGGTATIPLGAGGTRG